MMIYTALLLLFALQRPAAPPAAGASSPSGPTLAAATGQLAEAEARYRTAIAATPGIAAYHESLALVLERGGRLDEALAEHQAAVRLDSLAFRNRAGLGHLLVRLGRHAEAVPHLQAASTMDRTSVDVRKSLATALLQLQRRDEALVALREAQRLDSSDSDVERSIKQAEATAPGMGRPNDATATSASHGGRLIRSILEWTFAVVLGAASLALVVPLLGGGIVALVRGVRGPSSRVPA
ncbi:MAG: yrrB 2 [Gemmatimonadetes bacterium]|nr:yrrB 2 [Gemmatimonadota bacterium]